MFDLELLCDRCVVSAVTWSALPLSSCTLGVPVLCCMLTNVSSSPLV